MNINTVKRAFRGLALALAAPGMGWAGDHYLGLINVTNVPINNTAGGGGGGGGGHGSCTGTTPTTELADKAIVNGGSGAVTTGGNELTLTGLCNNDGTRSTVNFTGTLTLVFRNVKMCKSWTAKNNTTVYDWLDQGSTRIGATGTLTGSSSLNSFRTVLTMSTPVSVDTATTACTVNNQGAYDYTVTRTAAVDRLDGTTWNRAVNANFTFGNVANALPEPGTLSLLVFGLAGLGWVGARRARRARASSV